MSQPLLDSLDRDVIESVLQMGGGYVLDFSDRTFAEFFDEFDVPIDDGTYRVDGHSKAKRMRAFLRNADPALVGRVLAALLERRLIKSRDGLNEQEVERYRKILARLGAGSGASVEAARSSQTATTEDELLRNRFRPEALRSLPLDAALVRALIARLDEAQRCVECQAYLSAVILCGSVLEGLCLGVGIRDPERVNKAYTVQYNRKPPLFHQWKLKEWIEVLGRIGDLSPNVSKFGHALRDFRNYVHPQEQLAHKFSPDAHTARISFHVVVAAIEDLGRATKGPPA